MAGVANIKVSPVKAGTREHRVTRSCRKLGVAGGFCNGGASALQAGTMSDDLKTTLERIATALERLAPAPEPVSDFSAARLFRHDAAKSAFIPAPDYGLALDLLVGVDRQKEIGRAHV